MRRWPERILVFGSMVVLTLAVLACGGDEDVFRIGVMESLTGPGETYGTVAHQAKQMAADEINAAGGIDGRRLELVVEDSQCNAQSAITAYNKLTDVEGVKIILGTSCSGAMLGAAPLAEADGVILFSGLASNPDIAKAGDYIFRTQISDVQVGIGTGNVLWEDGIRRLATITEATDYAEGVRRTTVAQFEKRGGTVVAEERYPVGRSPTSGAQLTQAVRGGAGRAPPGAPVRVLGGDDRQAGAGAGVPGPDLRGDDIRGHDRPRCRRATAADGMKAITADLDPANEKGQEVLANFRERYDYVTLPWHLGSAYDNVYIAAECLKQTGDDQDADGFRDCMYAITWSGAIGDHYQLRLRRRGGGAVSGGRRGAAGRRAHRGAKVQGPRPRPQAVTVHTLARLPGRSVPTPPAVAWTQPEAGPRSTWAHVRTEDGAESWVSHDDLEHD